MAMDVFHDHNRIIDQNPDGENQCEQRYAIERKTPRPRSKQRRHQGQCHRSTDNRGFASSQREIHQRHHGKRCEYQLLNQFNGLVIRRRTVVARFCNGHIGRNHGVLQLPNTRHDFVRDINRIRTRFFRHAHGDSRIFAKRGIE